MMQARILGDGEAKWLEGFFHPKMEQRLGLLQKVTDLRLIVDHVSILTYNRM